MFSLGCISSILLLITINAQEYHVKDFGAIGNGIADDSNAVRAAMNASIKSGGGRVIFDEGYAFLTGCFSLTNNLILDVRGSILGSNETDYYYIPNTKQMSNALIYSWNVNNITITGGGIIDGQGHYWWQCGRNFSYPPCSYRPNLIRLVNVSNVQMNNITIRNSPEYNVHFMQSNNIHINNINISDPQDYLNNQIPPFNNTSPVNQSFNTDGIHFDNVQNALVENSYISTGDDALAIDADIGAPPSENITIRNMQIGFANGLSIGGVTIGGIRNITFENIVVNGSLVGPNIRARSFEGGLIQDITYRNISLHNMRNCFKLDMNWTYEGYHPPSNNSIFPKYQNINIHDLTCDNVENAVYLGGLDFSEINANFWNIKITNIQGEFIEKCNNIYGSCDNSTFFPYCSPCMTKTKCEDTTEDCNSYLSQCNNPTYHTLLCNKCRRTCNLCGTCNT